MRRDENRPVHFLLGDFDLGLLLGDLELGLGDFDLGLLGLNVTSDRTRPGPGRKYSMGSDQGF